MASSDPPRRTSASPTSALSATTGFSCYFRMGTIGASIPGVTCANSPTGRNEDEGMDEIRTGQTIVECDVLVIGGGTAGPMAAYKAKRRNPNARVILLEKANVKRS